MSNPASPPQGGAKWSRGALGTSSLEWLPLLDAKATEPGDFLPPFLIPDVAGTHVFPVCDVPIR